MTVPNEDDGQSTATGKASSGEGPRSNADPLRPSGSRSHGGGTARRAAWETALRSIDRKRRAMTRLSATAAGGTAESTSATAAGFIPSANARPSGRPPVPISYFPRATVASFQLDGLPTQDEDVRLALSRSSAADKSRVRSRQAQRIRNHVAVLLHVESLLRQNQPLSVNDIIRSYASISCGLSTARIDDPTLTRLSALVDRVNSPQLRLPQAVQDIVQLHQRLLTDPFVPAFNGILARVILHFHLGRCGLPPIIFTPPPGAPVPLDLQTATRRMLELLDEAYDGKRAATGPSLGPR